MFIERKNIGYNILSVADVPAPLTRPLGAAAPLTAPNYTPVYVLWNIT